MLMPGKDTCVHRSSYRSQPPQRGGLYRTPDRQRQARVFRNANTFGLYSAGDVVRPEQESLHQPFCEDFERQITPRDAMQTTLFEPDQRMVRYGMTVERPRAPVASAPLETSATRPGSHPNTQAFGWHHFALMRFRWGRETRGDGRTHRFAQETGEMRFSKVK